MRGLREVKVLVMSDDPHILYVVSKYLEIEGFDVVTAIDIKTALNIIEGEDFHFVIWDIKTPEVMEIDFFRMLKEKKPSLMNRLIFCTCGVEDHAPKEVVDSIPMLNLEKPFNLEKLKKVITLKSEQDFGSFLAKKLLQKRVSKDNRKGF